MRLTGSGTARADRLFAAVTRGAGGFVVVLVLLVAGFLAVKAAPALRVDRVNFLTSRTWDVAGHRFGIVDMLWATVTVSAVAMVIALPLAVGVALFITQYAPRRLARPVAHVVDLLAAIPSIVYGIWGILVLAPLLRPVQDALGSAHWIPLFGNEGYSTGTIFDGGVVLAVMILPIITAVARDVFERTPVAHLEAARALGATRWETIRLTVLPHGRSGIVSGAMLGLGRALGETVALYLILSKPPAGPFSPSLFAGGETFASKIASNAAEFSTPTQTGAYLAAGLVLFALTFVVNAVARWIARRGDAA
ncbi:MAG: phosphate ABC transporter permease subunit PstC [Jatrophihabitans sp.]|nr:MAG: phosphate ABC transporter permease subunit PstC [Jatrophihabitans sp.]